MTSSTNSPPRLSPALITAVLALLCTLLIAVTPASGATSLSVAISTPRQGATVAGNIPWVATATGTIRSIDFYVDGTRKWTELRAPYEYYGDNTAGLLETSKLSNGPHELKVVANGAGGRTATAKVVVNVLNATAPSVSIATPANGATLSGSAVWDAATSGVVTRVVFLVDGIQKWVETSAPYRYNGDGRFDTTSLANGRHDLATRVEGPSGTSTAAIAVNVSNVQAPPPLLTYAPANTAKPVVTGSAAVGQTLSASQGVWTGTAPLVQTQAWQRCTAGSCTAIPTAAARTYAVTSADVGATVRVLVTATNAVGFATAASAETAVVLATPVPTPTPAPSPTPAGSAGSALPARMAESSGASFYVDGVRGSDANPGTLAAPWKSINQALAAVPLSGSVINVRAGTYVGMHVFQNRYASVSNPITLQPYPGERVVLTAPANQDQHVLLVFKAGGIRIRGFEITDPTSDLGIKVENGKDVEIVGCDIHHTGRSGVFVGGSGTSGPTGSSNVQIWSNRFHDDGGNMAVGGGASSGQGGHSVYWGGVSSNSDGIDHRTVGGVIANNLFYNQPYGFQLQIGTQADGLIVTNNTFYRAYYPSGAGTAIEFYTESSSASAFGTRNVTVINNLITNAVTMGVYGYGGGGAMSSNSVRNNLAYGNAQGDFLSYYGSTANVLFTLGTNITGKNPLFVDAGSLNFRLQSTSPAIGKADPNYTPATDFAGNPRTGAPDLGAYES